DVARHLFRVTAGLESMIVGEAEVQGQVKRAYELALDAGVTGPLTNRMFGAALATGKRARAETALAQRRGSVPSVAVDLAQETLGALSERRWVVLGTGELGGVTLYDIDDLQAVVARNLQVRQAEARAADAIVEEEIKRFAGWLGSLEVLPTIAALRTHGEDIVDAVLAENEPRFEDMSE